ncbi:MAG: hypothetical protein ACI8W1_002719 [Candidatus Azotimanducaceae bacterium]|jgi:hypothetical protein
MAKLLLTCLLLLSPIASADSDSIDAIINAYYDVVSGSVGHKYDDKRDQNLHAENAIITKFDDKNNFQRHDLPTEQRAVPKIYTESFYEIEVSREVQRYENIAHVWSEFEVRETQNSESFSGGFNSISLYFKDDRWWISSWSTQYKN